MATATVPVMRVGQEPRATRVQATVRVNVSACARAYLLTDLLVLAVVLLLQTTARRANVRLLAALLAPRRARRCLLAAREDLTGLC